MHKLGQFAPSRVVMAAAGLLVFLMGFVSPAAASEPAADRTTTRFEIMFMTNMIDHHAMAVHMAQMCRDKAVHGQLLTLCKDIRTGQRREIREMRSWLRDWYDTDHKLAKHMTDAEARLMHEMEAMPGRLFEIHFMTMMIPHHQQAIREATTCLDRADHRDLRQLCRNIIKTQTAEIRMMRSWLCQWYDRCDGRPEPGHPHGPGRVA